MTKSSIRIDFDNGKSEFYICPCQNCTGKRWDTAYSYRHARDLGWYVTRTRDFSPNGEDVAVCNPCYTEWLLECGWKPVRRI